MTLVVGLIGFVGGYALIFAGLALFVVVVVVVGWYCIFDDWLKKDRTPKPVPWTPKATDFYREKW